MKIFVSARKHNAIVECKNTIIHNQQRDIKDLQVENDYFEDKVVEYRKKILRKEKIIDDMVNKMAKLSVELLVLKRKNGDSPAKTNFDIISKSPESLSKFMKDFDSEITMKDSPCGFCGQITGDNICTVESCDEGFKIWLESEYEGGCK